MTSMADLVDETIDDYLMTGTRPMRAQLSAAVDDTTTTIPLTNLMVTPAPGMIIQAGFEQMGVWSFSDPDATVLRGDNRSTAAAHLIDAIVEFDPVFPRSAVLGAMLAEAASLDSDPDLWKPTTITLTPSTADDLYDLGTGTVKDVVSVVQLQYGDWVPLHNWTVVRGLTGHTGITGDVGLQIYDGAVRSSGEIRVVVKGSLGTLTQSTVDVETTFGLPNARLLAVGAAIHLNAGRAVKRSLINDQGSARRANEVQAFQTISSGRELKALHKQLKQEAMVWLRQQYPHRRKRR